MNSIFLLPRRILSLLIRGYQKTLSPDHGPFRSRYPHGFCRHYPTCSEYAHKAITRHGAVKGLGLAFFRVIRCNPWAEPSVDPVPERFSQVFSQN